MIHHRYLFMLFQLISILFIIVPSHVSAAGLLLEYNEGKLSADVKEMPLQKVLEQLAGKTDIEIVIDASLRTRKVSSRFSDIDMEQGIKKLVKPYNTTIVFEKKSSMFGRDSVPVLKVSVYDAGNTLQDYIPVGVHSSFSAGETTANILDHTEERQNSDATADMLLRSKKWQKETILFHSKQPIQ